MKTHTVNTYYFSGNVAQGIEFYPTTGFKLICPN